MKKITYGILFLVLGLVSTARAQIYLAKGTNGGSGVVTKFSFSINDTANTVQVLVQNTIAGGPNNNVKGVLMGFGFNTPENVHILSFTQQWGALANGHNSVPTPWASAETFNLSPRSLVQDFGVFGGSNANGGNIHNGLWFGETALFTFQFTDFTSANNFLGNNGITARWQAIENGVGGLTSDKGWGNFDSDLPPIPEPSTYGAAGAFALIGLLLVRRFAPKRSPRPQAGNADVK